MAGIKSASNSSENTVAAEVVNALRELGVKYVFGVPSGGWVDYMEALRRTPGIEFILTTHEGGAGMMADVCGRLDRRPGSASAPLAPAPPISPRASARPCSTAPR